ncbi:hypothetical protein NC653_027307 [Populus alba x Populus x berolinensis]|uniref:Uncharacterized protein n=1 Tax=Populus alba x Populus x berolinensis TaxID=444605 RepID=A0AAD6M578_9ROSI|nr:hypothetical protein NC653_027307 [Populus alba x Populus x berolinensis]
METERKKKKKRKHPKAKRQDIPSWMAARKTALINLQRRWNWHRSHSNYLLTIKFQHCI